MTVRIYRSTDTGAPTLTGQAGTLVNVLDACLVNGYNSNNPPGAGWTTAFTGTNQRIYRQPAGSNQMYLRVDDTFGTYARAFGCEQATALATGNQTNLFPTSGQIASGVYWYKADLADAQARQWVLVSNGKFFYLYVSTYNISNNFQPSVCYFGDITSARQATPGYQHVSLSGNSVYLNSSTNLVAGTQYSAILTVDGVAHPFAALGSTISTYAQLVSSLQAAVGSAATVILQPRGLLSVISNTTGTSSSVALTTATINTTLIHFDGASGSQVTTDVGSNLTVGAGIAAQLDDSQFKFGTASASFTGSGSEHWYIADNPAHVMGALDFVVELQFKPDSIGPLQVLISKATGLSTVFPFQIYLTAAGHYRAYLVDSGLTTYSTTDAGATAVVGQWNHIALVRAAGLVKLYVDGVATDAGVTVSNPLATTTGALTIGGYSTLTAYAAPIGHIDEVRITKGSNCGYTSNFTPPSAPFPDQADPSWSSVGVLLNLNGTNGASVATEAAHGAVVTFSGGATLSTAQFKFGTASAVFTNSGEHIDVTSNATYMDMGSGNFTLELFYRPSSIGTSQSLIGKATGTSWYPYNIRLLASGHFGGFATDGATAYVTADAGPTAVAGQWYHLALVRYSNVLKLYVNGVATDAGVAISSALFFDTAPLCIGAYSSTYTTNGANGYIDSVRLTKGVARYIAPFSPPVAEFPEGTVSTTTDLFAAPLYGFTSLGTSVPGLSSTDTYATMIYGQSAASATNNAMSDLLLYSGDTSQAINGAFLCRPNLGTVGAIRCAIFANTNLLSGGSQAGAPGALRLPFPEPVAQKIYMSPLYIAEQVADGTQAVVRGQLPGVWCVANNGSLKMQTKVRGDILTPNGTLTGKTLETFQVSGFPGYVQFETSDTW